ncbi:ANTH domain-containing protein [bacterium]|nr:ANTH domain-containing protein [bacterium]
MSRPDAERALNIYRSFGRQTEQVVRYLSLARQYERLTRLEVPKLKHAPTSLVSSLEEYLNDPDFEINRRQYLAQKQGPKSVSKPAVKSEASSTPADKSKKSEPTSKAPAEPAAQAATAPSGPAPDLIDFFDSIEQNQRPMAQPVVTPQPLQNGHPQAQQYQQPGFYPQQTGFNPFWQNQQQTGPYAQPQQLQQPQQPFQPAFTDAGYGSQQSQPLQQSHSSPAISTTSIISNIATIATISATAVAAAAAAAAASSFSVRLPLFPPFDTSKWCGAFRSTAAAIPAAISTAISADPAPTNFVKSIQANDGGDWRIDRFPYVIFPVHPTIDQPLCQNP